MIEISLCMIVKNEELFLKRCLESIKEFCDEIIIVDTGSTDITKLIANEYHAKIYDFNWCDDFSKARNFSFSKATKEYIFWLDADDYITEDNLKQLLTIKETIRKEIDIVSMNYSLLRDKNEKTIHSLRRCRLVKREMGYLWKGRIHEYLDVIGNTFHSDIFIYHKKETNYTTRNLEIFRLMEQNKEEFSQRDVFYYANELYDNGEYEDAIEQYEKFLELEQGWVEDLKSATANLIMCYTFTNQESKRMKYILNTFKWGVPRADICCKLAEEFLVKQKFNDSIFWYKVARKCKYNKQNMGIDMKEYYTWIPTIQLCVCYTNIGQYKTAYYYNELTEKYIPGSQKVENNRVFLENKMLELKMAVPQYDIFLKEQVD